MAFGTLGSTLNDELNRLANGGTYRTMPNMVDDALAAKQWANRENIVPYSTDTVGILNEIAALGPNRQNWFDFNGVCNYLAGTTGLPAAAALRQITTTGDILTSLAAFYVDAVTPYGSSNSGFVYLNGSAGNYISTPDAAALDITGDIDLRAYIAPDTWIPATASTIISKWLSTGNQRSFRFQITTTGLLSLAWTTDGATGTLIQVNSTVATGLLNSQAKWVRATLDVSNGASGYDVAFYLSDNGTTWTQLGTTVTSAGTASIYSGSANVEIGSLISGTTENFAGEVFRAQILNGIGGTTVLDANCSVVTSQAQTSFTATTGQAMSIFKTSEQMNVVSNLGSAGSLLPVTVGSSTAADSNDAKFLDHTGTNYVYLPGVAGNYLSVPNAAPLQITGDIDLRAQVALDSWTPTGDDTLISKFGAGGNRSYRFTVTSTGNLSLIWSADGTNLITVTSSVATGIANGTTKWVRATLDVDNGASGNSVQFFTSDNGTTWTQLGTTVTTAGVTSIFNSTWTVDIGTDGGAARPLDGKIFRAQIFSDITGTTKVLDVDTSVITTGAATSFTAVTGQTVTINRSTSGRKTVAVTQPTWLFGTDDYMEVNNRYMDHSTSSENYVYLSGASGNCLTVADNPPLDITGDLDIQVRAALDDWTPAGNQALLYKWGNAGTRSYAFLVGPGGLISLYWTPDGSTSLFANSTVAPTVADGGTLWVRATLDVDNGASGKTVTFYTSTNGNTWTQLGSAVTTTGTTSIYSGSAQVTIGADSNVGTPAKGAFYRAIIKNGIDGTTVLDANAAVITLPSQTTFTDSSSNAYTVTINKSGVGTFVSTGNYLYLPGVAGNWATAPDSAALDITGDIDIRVKVAMDDWTPAAITGLVGKSDTAADAYYFVLGTNGRLSFAWLNSLGISLSHESSAAPTVTDGGTLWVRVTLDVDNGAAGYDCKFFTSTDGVTWTQLGTTFTGAGVTNIRATTAQLNIGNRRTSLDLARGKFFRAQVYNGIGGTVAFDANFEGSITSLNQASFTESSSNAATVTINRSGSAYRSAGVIDAGYLYPGATNTFANSTTNFLDIDANTSATFLVIARQWGTPTSFGRYIDKIGTYSSGWGLRTNGTSIQSRMSTVSGGTTASSNAGSVLTAGTLQSVAGVVNRSTGNQTIYVNSTAGETTTARLDLTNLITTMCIGGGGSASGSVQDFELIGAAVFRSVLTPAQIRQITNYFANREVYL